MPKKIKEVFALIDKTRTGDEYLITLSGCKKNLLYHQEKLKKDGFKFEKACIYKFSNKETVKQV